MKLQVVRTQFGLDATNGLLFIDGKFECFTLEDQYQAVKVAAETAIPEGSYKITLRTVGGFHSKYLKRYSFHKGMLWVRDVPGFEYILIHTGNTDEHTAGCLLVGETQQDLDKGKDGFIGGSGDAYKKMYMKVLPKLLSGEEVTIEYSQINLDGAAAPQQSSDKDMLSAIHEKVTRIDAKLRGKPIIQTGDNMSDELKALIEKVVWTFVEAFGSALLVGPAMNLDITAIQAAAIAGGGSVIVVLKEYAKKQLAGK